MTWGRMVTVVIVAVVLAQLRGRMLLEVQVPLFLLLPTLFPLLQRAIDSFTDHRGQIFPVRGAAEQELAALADAQLEPHAGAQGEEGTPVEAESTATPNLRAHSRHATEPANCGVPLPLMTQHQRQSDQR